MIKKAVMLVSVLILSAGIAFATSNPNVEKVENDTFAMITGSVVDSNTGEAVINATVLLAGTEKTTTTDENGTFAFEEIEMGNHTLSVEADGYQKKEKSVDVTEEGANIELKVAPEM